MKVKGTNRERKEMVIYVHRNGMIECKFHTNANMYNNKILYCGICSLVAVNLGLLSPKALVIA